MHHPENSDMQYVSLFLCVFILSSCHQPGYQIRTYHHSGYTLTDTLFPSEKYFYVFDGEAQYPIYYIGPAKGNISITQKIERHTPRDTATRLISRTFDSTSLSVEVIDSISTFIQTEFSHFDTSANKYERDSVVTHPAFMLVLKNHSDSTLWLGDKNFLQFIRLEVQNDCDQWIPVELPSGNSYGPDSWLSYIYLLPEHMLIAKFPEYERNYSHNCRLAWTTQRGSMIYSNEFWTPVSNVIHNIANSSCFKRTN